MPSELTADQQRQADAWNRELRYYKEVHGFVALLKPAEYDHVIALGIDPDLVDKYVYL